MTLRARAAIIGLSGHSLTGEEAALLRATPPLGIILFARNIADPGQLRALTASIREELGEAAPVLVDQEGGRVARLRAPHWPDFPPAARFEGAPEEAARANAALHGLICREAGFDVVCAPVLDLRMPGAHGIIGDRAFSDDPEEVARLGLAWAEGLQQAGCIPVVKHVPGHGRALVDSHYELPRVTAPREMLVEDCGPFAALADLAGWAMTAHIVYDALDPERPATLSPLVIGEVIRRAIGFPGILVSDDLCMKALHGEPGALAQQAIEAGCDLVLHCNGVLAEGAALLEACPLITDSAEARLAETRARVLAARAPLDAASLLALRDAQLTAAA
ncbi:beta-N-acetylhexosaminidase [Belnapia rosea]|uniref:beta-N-acetylhexosaminidase n=1 Tax=Belnapia rosea TaxID=938405 RepID=UPI00088EE0C1|nr:beta-N-acetylhexosaminidase [Belnapia rosea]SDB70524.1 beta-N-acetylhexosaminidase [Belnapia rosea]